MRTVYRVYPACKCKFLIRQQLFLIDPRFNRTFNRGFSGLTNRRRFFEIYVNGKNCYTTIPITYPKVNHFDVNTPQALTSCRSLINSN